MTRQEWPLLDDALYEVQAGTTPSTMRCQYCEGHLQPEAEEGEYTCLICARSSSPRREVDQLVERLADRILEHRKRQN